MFEIRSKDNLGRTGVLKTEHGEVRTPALMPVIHPGKQTIDVKRFGAEIVITNAYIIYRNPELRDEALRRGVHGLINFDGPVMTDSGSFQLSEYGDVEVENHEIVRFQDEIGTDIGTSLDIPTPPGVSHRRALEEVEITLQRARESLEYRERMMLNAVVQGSTHPDLRRYCASQLAELPVELHPIGAVVPLMESYRYRELVDAVLSSVSELPPSRPRHLMGAGHPMIFALAASMGCDLFDSAAYILYAEDDRLLSTEGTYKLENLQEMPCSCRVCTDYTPSELRGMEAEDRRNLIAEHNLHVSFAEIRKVRQAIYDGSLMELVEERCRAHPRLLEGYRRMSAYVELSERFEPRSKRSAFFYTGPESLGRVEVHRHLQWVKKNLKGRMAIAGPSRKPYSSTLPSSISGFRSMKPQADGEWRVVVADVPFGLIPLELDQVYPLAQSDAPGIMDLEARHFLRELILDLEGDVIISEDLCSELGLQLPHPYSGEVETYVDDLDRIRMIAEYQFGEGAGDALFPDDVRIERSRNTGKIRHIYSGEKLICTMRASDGLFVLSAEGARRLHDGTAYPRCRVAVNEESEPFAREGRSVFAKFIIDCDNNIRAGDEVLIVNAHDELLATGRALLCAEEMMDLNHGQAVKTRKGGF